MSITWPAGYSVTQLDSAGSTNDLAKDAATAGAADGAVFWTSNQTAGRGTHGREWTMPPGNLAVSVLKRPQMPIRFAPQAALVTAVAVSETLVSLGLARTRVKLKWPNDVLVDGAKVSGILMEGQADGRSVDWLVIGTGVNVLHHPPKTRHTATDLAEAGLAVTAEQVLEQYLVAFEKWWSRWRRYDFQVIQTAWTAQALHRPGDKLVISQGEETLQARYKRLSVDGALVVEGHGRARETIGFG